MSDEKPSFEANTSDWGCFAFLGGIALIVVAQGVNAYLWAMAATACHK